MAERGVGLGGQGGIAGDSPLTQPVQCGGPRAPGPSTQHVHFLFIPQMLEEPPGQLVQSVPKWDDL